MKMRVVLLLGVLVFLIPNISKAFDGARKGFVMGAGIGLGALSTWTLDDKSIDESGMGIGSNVTLGYGLDDQNLINWQWNGNSYDIEYFDHLGVQFFTGPTWYHYFTGKTKSLFSVVGFWEYAVWNTGEGYYATGKAVLVGAGYEFARHFQIGAYYVHARTHKSCCRLDKGNNNHLNILVTALAY
jgi:hypothetical protein